LSFSGLPAGAYRLTIRPAEQVAATTVVGGSSLLGASDLTQLQTWLGEGPLTLTNLFSRTPGDGKTSSSFHAAVDGKGPTFSVVEVQDTQGNVRQVVGGYDPQSWDSSGAYHLTPNAVNQTGFLFNLTTGDLQLQGGSNG